MRRVCYSVAASLDGYIAGPKGEFDWIPDDPDIDFGDLLDRFDAAVMGRISYQAMLAGPSPVEGMETLVVSRTLAQADCPGVRVVAEDPVGAVRALRAKPGKDIWLFGGGGLFGTLAEAGEVDEVEVAVVPILLGGGVPLLPGPATRVRLRLQSQRVYSRSGIVMLRYAVSGRTD